MAQGAPLDPGQRPQPLRSHQPALQWPSQGCGSAPQPAYRYEALKLDCLAWPQLPRLAALLAPLAAQVGLTLTLT